MVLQTTVFMWSLSSHSTFSWITHTKEKLKTAPLFSGYNIHSRWKRTNLDVLGPLPGLANNLKDLAVKTITRELPRHWDQILTLEESSNVTHLNRLPFWFFIPTYCWSWLQHFSPFNLARKFGSHFCIESFALPKINSMYYFLDWEDHHLTTAIHLFMAIFKRTLLI